MLSQVRLEGKRVLLGVTGSIAAYKACEVARLFIKAGAEVRVVMSESAKRFVTPLSFEALTNAPVLHESTESWANESNHIALGEWADIMVIAPATANTLNKMASGIADNLLLQTALAFDKPIVVAPAANTRMIEHPATVANLKRLALGRVETVSPQTKLLACGTEGNGAMAEPTTVFASTLKHLLARTYWRHRRVVVTGGGTIEKIDEVRYLSNFSSGKMAEALVTALYSAGADVCYVCTYEPKAIPPVHVIRVESAQEMMDYTADALRVAKKGVLLKPDFHNNLEAPKLVQKTPWLFMAAAVSDYRPAHPQNGKLKKEALGERWSLEMVQNPDILASLDKTGVKTLAFKAEMDPKNALSNARKALDSKGVDAVALNILRDSESFGTADNALTLVHPGGQIDLPRTNKTALAFALIEALERL